MGVKEYQQQLSASKIKMLGFAPLIYLIAIGLIVAFYAIKLASLGALEPSFVIVIAIPVSAVTVLAYVLRFRLDYGVYFIFKLLKREQFYLNNGYIGMIVIATVLYFWAVNGILLLIILSLLNQFLKH